MKVSSLKLERLKRKKGSLAEALWRSVRRVMRGA